MAIGILEAIFVLVLVLVLLYLFLTWNFNEWRKRGVNGPTPKLLVGTLPNLFSQKQHYAIDLANIYNEYKQTDHYVGIYMLRTPQLLVLDPELIHKIFVTDFKHFQDNDFGKLVDKKKDPLFANNPFILNGTEWKHQRALVTPGLTGSRIKAAYAIMKDVADAFCNFIEQEMKMSHTNGFNGKELALRFTAENVCDAVLGLKANSFKDDRIPVHENIKVFEENTILLVYSLISGLLPSLLTVYKPKLMPSSCEKFFYNLMQQAFHLRASHKVDRQDFLNYLLTLREKHGLTDIEIASHTMSFLLDGLDTTATTISHCMLLLGRYPFVQQHLREEIMQNVDKNGHMSFEKINELPYLDACIHESMRIFPPASFHAKVCTEPYTFTNKNGSKLRVEKGDAIIIPAYGIYHDPNHFFEPQEFKPERFLPENGGIKKYKDLGLFFPFGDGPRMCMGFRFALTQTKTALAAVIRKFNVKVNPKTKSENNLDAKSFSTLQDGGVWLDFEKRID